MLAPHQQTSASILHGPSRTVLLTAAAGLKRFPDFDKLWLMLGQLEERRGAPPTARAAYANGIKRNINSVPLWRVCAVHKQRNLKPCVLEAYDSKSVMLLFPGQAPALYMWPVGRQASWMCSAGMLVYHIALQTRLHRLEQAAARLEEKAGNVSKARATLEQARHRNSGSEELWLAAVRTELRAGLPQAAESLMARALQVAPPAFCTVHCTATSACTSIDARHWLQYHTACSCSVEGHTACFGQRCNDTARPAGRVRCCAR